MVKIGMMIGDRYEILEKIGTGGMSDVYKAKCHKLNRFVAIKVLKQEFAENENFVSKFIIEAQAAAGLMHPNIVNVYDVGEENGIHYIVMELIEGITLKKYIEKKSRLSYKEAVSIAIQVSLGIEAAHNNNIIHRDIKPQNIIISKDGKVKVTDFGIAKAASSNTITSNVMGSVHYTSPEQARGGYSDAKSDIYSLGITMFEMVTGRVPFNGDTTVAIAIKHIQEELPYPSEFAPDIPVAVESIILKCCQKSPDRRYQNMVELVKDLKQALITPDEDFVIIGDPNMDAGTRPVTEREIMQVRNGADPYSDGGRNYPGDREDYVGEEYDDQQGYSEQNGAMSKLEKITAVIAVIVGIIILVIIIVLGKQLLDYILPQKSGEGSSAKKGLTSPIITEESTESAQLETQTREVVYREMPKVEGLSEDEAGRKITALGMIVSKKYVESDVVREWDVISADVEPGSMIEVGSTVTLTVSSGVEGVLVPDVTGYWEADATSMLSQAGFSVYKVNEYSDLEEGMVFNQNPASTGNGKAPKGSAVTIYVSKGKENVMKKVPSLVGNEQTAGTLIAIESGLNIGSITKVFDDKYPEGIICYQSYSAGVYVDEGTSIDIRVSLGEKHSYQCNTTIEAPNAAEAPDYRSGTEVRLKLVTDTGDVLLDTKTTSFPYSLNYKNVDSPGGILTVTYTVTMPGEASTDPATGETVVGASSTEEKSFTRRIDFTEE